MEMWVMGGCRPYDTDHGGHGECVPDMGDTGEDAKREMQSLRYETGKERTWDRPRAQGTWDSDTGHKGIGTKGTQDSRHRAWRDRKQTRKHRGRDRGY